MGKNNVETEMKDGEERMRKDIAKIKIKSYRLKSQYLLQKMNITINKNELNSSFFRSFLEPLPIVLFQNQFLGIGTIWVRTFLC